MKLPKLKNYTTTVSALRSINEIEDLLFKFGAKKIMKEAGDTGLVNGLSFVYPIDDQLVPFRLPIKLDKTVEYLYQSYLERTVRPRRSREDFEEEA